ncbi:hypothetical protein BH11PLA2_BH11PLA2_11500 [soil metagenome]
MNTEGEISDKVNAMDDMPASPPKFPVLTGITAGLWLLHGVIHAVLMLIAFFENRTGEAFKGSVQCCLPVSSLFMVAGLLAITGHLQWKFPLEMLAALIGLGEVFLSMALLMSLPAAIGGAWFVAALSLFFGGIFSLYDIDAYDRWILARERWQREHDDE